MTRCSTCSRPWSATDEQLDFPMLFASARQGWAATSLEAERKDLAPLFDLILRHVPAPHGRRRRAVRACWSTTWSPTAISAAC